MPPTLSVPPEITTDGLLETVDVETAASLFSVPAEAGAVVSTEVTFEPAVRLKLPVAVRLPLWICTAALEMDVMAPTRISPLNRAALWLLTLIVDWAARVMFCPLSLPPLTVTPVETSARMAPGKLIRPCSARCPSG